MYLQRILGLIAFVIGITAPSIIAISIGIFLILSKYDYVSLKYGDPRLCAKGGGE